MARHIEQSKVIVLNRSSKNLKVSIINYISIIISVIAILKSYNII